MDDRSPTPGSSRLTEPPAPPPPVVLYTARESAPILKMGKSKLYRLARDGKVPHRKIDGQIRFSDADLKQIVEDAARPAVA